MKMLFLSSWFPYPPINGAKIRIYNLIRQLARQHEITLLAFARTIPYRDARANIPHLEQYCRKVEVVPARSFVPSSFEAYKGFFSMAPRSVVDTFSQEMATLVKHEVQSCAYDVVVASEVAMPSVTSLLASQVRSVPKVLDAIEVSLAKDDFHTGSSPLRRARSGLTWFKLRRFTQDLLQEAMACTVPSRQEEHNLRAILPEHPCIKVIPHSLDMEYYQGQFDPREPNSLVFTGSFTYSANLDAAQYLVEQIYPHIKASVPDVRLRIVGSTKGADLATWPLDASIHFTGLLRDVRPRIAESTLSVVPLRVGAGTRLKIIESMALGTPVVSTSKGAEGLEVTHGKNILLADDPHAFAQAVAGVLRDPSLREELSVEGHKLVSEKYSAEVMGRQFNALLEAVVR